MSQIVDPDTDIDWCQAQLLALAQTMPNDASAIDVAQVLQEQGFHGSEAYYKSENSALGYVLQNREGIPISLAMVVLGVCEQLGLEATGINFPTHFLVSVGSTLIDPFTMTIADRSECQRWLKDNNLDARIAFTPASPTDTVLRMLDNLTGLARASNDSGRALELSDYKLAIAPELLPIYLERVELWLELGVADMARRDLGSAIELAPDDASKNKLRERLSDMADIQPKLH
ncbi:MAG: transglutaminase-like domain-containing protein [Gammaproteobacteria bacterium]|nr:transglutaminase-like domain-containing protein [Gammaproteobacteria bacterium]